MILGKKWNFLKKIYWGLDQDSWGTAGASSWSRFFPQKKET